MNTYKVLKNQEFRSANFKITPIRFSDKFLIMKWRNEQIDILRQEKPLTKKDQLIYFDNVILNLFDQDYPTQLLFSFLDGEKCLGYGGLVNINWNDKNAEISFIMDTKLEYLSFSFYWKIFLNLIEQLAFREIKLHKIFTYAYDLRPNLYTLLEEKNYNKEAILKEHYFYKSEYKDVVIHSKFNDERN